VQVAVDGVPSLESASTHQEGTFMAELLVLSRDEVARCLDPAALRARLAQAFGIHRAMDNLGAVGGALLGALVIAFYSSNLKDVLLVSAIPGLLCVALFAWGVREPRKAPVPVAVQVSWHWRAVPAEARGYLLTVMLFTFSRTAEVFIVLRAHELGASVVHALLLWAALNFVKIFANYAGGIWADRRGRFAMLVPGWALQSLAMAGFCLVDGLNGLWLAAIFFGFAMSVSEGVERAIIGEIATPGSRGTLFGWYYALVGAASIPAGMILGGLWQTLGSQVAYAFAALAGLLACAILQFHVAPRLSRILHAPAHRATP